MTLHPGDPAPDFQLAQYLGQHYLLDQLVGRVGCAVLLLRLIQSELGLLPNHLQLLQHQVF